jgi:two-component system NarL family response regulator
MEKPKISILCVDDHAVVREGLVLKLEQQPDMTVVATASSGEQAIDRYEEYRPDVTLMDLQLPGISGLEAIRSIRRTDPAARIVVLTMYDGEEDIHRALQAGAATYVLKETLADDLVQVIRAVYSGQRPILADVATRLASREIHSSLTAREVEVLKLIAEGSRNKEIADSLEIAEETVQVHVRHILSKLDVKDRTGAVTVALRRGIIHIR